MRAALFNGFLGTFLVLWLGQSVLGYPVEELWRFILASQAGGLIALLGTLQAESVPWVRKRLLNRSLKTWVLFVGLYYGAMLLLAPALLNVMTLGWLWLPLALSNGFVIIAFGPIQDFVVRLKQRRSRARARKTQHAAV